MSNKSAIIKLLADQGNSLVNTIRGNLNTTGTNASSQTSDSLEYQVNEQGEKIILTILGRPYFASVETGRGPRKSTESANLSNTILQWMEIREIGSDLDEKKRINLSKFITLKINREGTDLFKKGGRTDIFTQPFNSAVDEVNKSVVDLIAENFVTNIVKFWNGAQYNKTT